MTYTKTLIDEIKNLLPASYKLIVEHVTKNNGVELTGITVCQGNNTIAPVLYIDDLPDGITATDIVDKLIVPVPDLKANSIMSILNNPESLLSSVKFKIVSSNQDNTKYINIEYLDFAILFYIDIALTDGNGSVTIMPEHTTLTADDLFKAAKRNTDFISVNMSEMFGFPMIPMEILSNRNFYNGAGAILDFGLLDEVSSRYDDDIVLIPSSVHEVIAIPASVADPTMINIVKAINGDTDVIKPHEVLTNKLYKYARGHAELEIYAD